MNNTNKLLRAFIEAQGYEILEVRTKKGRPYCSLASSPAGVEVRPFEDGLLHEFNSDYKVTKSGKDNRLMGEGSKTLTNRLEISVKANKDLMDKNRKLQQLLALHLKNNGFNYTQIANELSVSSTVVKGYFRKAVRGLEKESRNESI